MVAGLEATLQAPFERVPRFRQSTGATGAALSTGEAPSEQIHLKFIPSPQSQVEWSGPTSTTIETVKVFIERSISAGSPGSSLQVRLFLSGRELREDNRTLQSVGISNNSILLATCGPIVDNVGQEEHVEAEPELLLSEEYDEQHAQIGVRETLRTAIPLRADFPAEWLSLALTIDGTGGGGHDEAVVYRNFGGIRRLADGRYHLVEAQGAGDSGLMHIWRYALRGYGDRAAQAHQAHA